MRLIASETRKVRTIWSSYVIVAIVVALDFLFGFLVALAPGGRRGGTAGLVPHGSSQWFVNVFSVLDNSRLLALVLGILIVTGEYRHKTVTPTFLVEPRRGRVVASKLVVGFGGGVILGVATMAAGLVIGGVLVGVGVHSCASLGGVTQGMSQATCTAQHGIYYAANVHDMWTEWSQIAPGVIAGTGLFAVYGVGLGALLKNQIVAIVVGLVFTLVVENIILAIWPTIAEYLPGRAATALEDATRTITANSNPILPWWGGLLMLVVYGVALTVIGASTTLRTDVT